MKNNSVKQSEPMGNLKRYVNVENLKFYSMIYILYVNVIKDNQEAT